MFEGGEGKEGYISFLSLYDSSLTQWLTTMPFIIPQFLSSEVQHGSTGFSGQGPTLKVSQVAAISSEALRKNLLLTAFRLLVEFSSL